MLYQVGPSMEGGTAVVADVWSLAGVATFVDLGSDGCEARWCINGEENACMLADMCANMIANKYDDILANLLSNIVITRLNSQ